MKTEFNKNLDQPNPYNELPRMNMCIIKIPDEIRRMLSPESTTNLI